MDNQEIFNVVSAHLLKQACKATDDDDGDGSCLYRAPYGRACAVGCLIPDSLYSPSMEGPALKSGEVGGTPYSEKRKVAQVWTALATIGVTQDSKALLYRLQLVHDFMCDYNWENQLHEVADDFGLVMVNHYHRPA